MPTDLVDVNVHPAKIEARFARENDVFDVVYHAVKLALAQPGTGERRFTFEADEKEKSEKENDIQSKNTVKNNHFTGLSAVIPGPLSATSILIAPLFIIRISISHLHTCLPFHDKLHFQATAESKASGTDSLIDLGLHSLEIQTYP